MRKLLFLFVVITSLITNSLLAQSVYSSSSGIKGYKKKAEKGGYDPSKLVIGGGFNFGFSSGYVSFGISPKVGYAFNQYLIAGVGFGYQYYKAPYSSDFPNIYNKKHIVYPSIWAKSNVWGPITINADLEYNMIFFDGFSATGINPITGLPPTYKATLNAPALLIGPGYKYALGGKVSALVEVMYDVIQNEYSPYYQQLAYRMSIFVGL